MADLRHYLIQITRLPVLDQKHRCIYTHTTVNHIHSKFGRTADLNKHFNTSDRDLAKTTTNKQRITV